MEKKEKKKKIKKEFFKKFTKILIQKNFLLKDRLIFNKYSIINSYFNRSYMYIYNGTVFRKLSINTFILCLKFGSFVFTRKIFKYLLKKKKR